jgi:hypothetical protein
MIKNIIDLLNMSDFYVNDPDIDFAKGINKLPRTRKDAAKFIKRNKKWPKQN